MSFFGKNIKKIRNVKRLSQSAFADLFQLTRASIGAYEEGRAEAKIDTIIEIAKYFSISVDNLLTKELTINDIYHFDVFKYQNNTSTKTNNSNNIQAKKVAVIFHKNFSDYIKSINNSENLSLLPQIVLPDSMGHISRVFQQKIEENHEEFLFCCQLKNMALENIEKHKFYVFVLKNSILAGEVLEKGTVLEVLPFSKEMIKTNISLHNILEAWECVGKYTTLLKPLSENSITLSKIADDLQRIKNKLDIE